MKLSIIVPVYNMAGNDKLKTCMESLLNQTVDDYEIICVDDKSTDDSLKLLRMYEKENECVKVIESLVNSRQGAAKNKGLAAANGDWVGFIDSDDSIDIRMYEKLLNKAYETEADIVGCDYVICDRGAEKAGKLIKVNDLEQTGILNDEKRKKLLINPGSMVVKIYKRSLFTENKIVFPEGISYEDNAVSALPFMYAKRFERVDEGLYYYYQYSDSTVHTVNLKKCRERITAMSIYHSEYTSRGLFEKYKEEITYKLFELGYRNTLFSYMQEAEDTKLSFVKECRDFLISKINSPVGNTYYEARTDKETKKFVSLHLKGNLLFMMYYKALRLYRKVRYKNA